MTEKMGRHPIAIATLGTQKKNLIGVRTAEHVTENIWNDGQHYQTCVTGAGPLTDLELWNLGYRCIGR